MFISYFSYTDIGVEIISPNIPSTTNEFTKGLILVISPSIATSTTIKEYLADLNYNIGGPFNSIDEAHRYLKTYRVDAIIIDIRTSVYELETFEKLLQTEVKDTPVILLSNIEYSFNHVSEIKLSNPTTINALEKGLNKIMAKDSNNSVISFVSFLNELVDKIKELIPEDNHKNIASITDEAVQRLSHRNSSFLKTSSEDKSLIITSYDDLTLEDLILTSTITLEEMIEDIDAIEGINWGRSLITDAIESLMINQKLTPELSSFISEFGVDIAHFEAKVASIIPNVDQEDKDCVVFNIGLADMGPEFRYKISKNETLKAEINEGLASQIITLVGQGSSYHEGIFGPIPIPSSLDLTAYICSRVVSSDIKDQRMNGQSLNVLAIGFKRSLLNSIPNIMEMNDIFTTYLDVDHEKKIDVTFLEGIYSDFLKKLND